MGETEDGRLSSPCLLTFVSALGLHSHPTHFGVTTSVRPTWGFNSFVAASSGVSL